MPRVAIITPVYNAAAYVEETILSVLAQRFEDWQMVLVDDGSTDASLEICKKFEGDARIKVVSQPNAGVASARNHGVSLAEHADYFTFLDSDDLLHPDFLQDAVSYLDRHREVALYRSKIRRIRGNGERWNPLLDWRTWNLQRQSWRLFQKDLARLFLLLGTFPPVGVLIRASSVTGEPWFNESLFGTEDSELWTRLAVRGEKMHLSARLGGCYRIRASSISTDIEKRKTNYRKWLNHSLASTTDPRYAGEFRLLVEAMMEFQISNGFEGLSQQKQAENGIATLKNLEYGLRDPLAQHVIYCSLMNNGLPQSAAWLQKLGAQLPALIAADLMTRMKSRNLASFGGCLLKNALLHPLRTSRAFMMLAGMVPCCNATN